jgi:hypothetical protein
MTVDCPIWVVRRRDVRRLRLDVAPDCESGRVLTGQGGRECIFGVEPSSFYRSGGAGKEFGNGGVLAIHFDREEFVEVGRETGLALGDELVVYPSGGDEGRREDSLRREVKRVADLGLEGSELGGSSVRGRATWR